MANVISVLSVVLKIHGNPIYFDKSLQEPIIDLPGGAQYRLTPLLSCRRSTRQIGPNMHAGDVVTVFHRASNTRWYMQRTS